MMKKKYGMLNDMLGALCNAVFEKISIIISNMKEAKQKEDVISVIR